MPLEPHGRHRPKAEDVLVEPDLELRVDRHVPGAGAAQHVVEGERREQRQPFEQHAAEEAAQAAEREAEQPAEDPECEHSPLGRDAVRREDRGGEHEIGTRHDNPGQVAARTFWHARDATRAP
jgi:hypothetical protein